MATGSGKTKVMAWAIVWQYFNAEREEDEQYAKTFLVLAPNVIVFERLKEDFANGKSFRTDPLKQAIVDNIVKRPIKGISKIEPAKSELASVKYEGFLVAAVERWKEYQQQLAQLGKKPIVFIILNSTKEADEVADWLRKKYATEFGDEKTRVIHTDRKGEISKKV